MGLVYALRKLKSFGGYNVRLTDLNFTYNQHSNFQKLRYWGFVEKNGDGTWNITTSGLDFLGGSKVRKTTVSYRGSFVRAEGFLITWRDVVIAYKKKKEYIEDSSARTT
jgi:hypothetical protein